MKIALMTSAALVLLLGNSAAQHRQHRASASIQATATVVQALGVTSPEDNLLRENSTAGPAVIDIPVNGIAPETLSLHRMLVRYPSSGSVVVAIESDTKEPETFALSSWHQSSKADKRGEILSPGAILLDLTEINSDIYANGSTYVLTLIYSEN